MSYPDIPVHETTEHDLDVARFSDDPQYEHDLLQKARTGDQDAYANLQAILEPQLTRFIIRLVGSGEVDDIVQDVFITLYKNLDRIDPPQKLRPFIFRSARNRCYDELRRRGRYAAVTLEDEGMVEWISLINYDARSRPEDVAHWLMLHMEVQEAMDQLPELQRQTLILYAEEGLSYAEIAEVMNTSIGTVKSRLYYAKRQLRKLLHPDTLRALDEDLTG